MKRVYLTLITFLFMVLSQTGYAYSTLTVKDVLKKKDTLLKTPEEFTILGITTLKIKAISKQSFAISDPTGYLPIEAPYMFYELREKTPIEVTGHLEKINNLVVIIPKKIKKVPVKDATFYKNLIKFLNFETNSSLLSQALNKRANLKNKLTEKLFFDLQHNDFHLIKYINSLNFINDFNLNELKNEIKEMKLALKLAH